MARIATFSLAIFFICFGIEAMNQFNHCYESGCQYTPQNYVLGTGKKFINHQINPLINTSFMAIDDKGNTVSMTKEGMKYLLENQTLVYTSPNPSILDTFNFLNFAMTFIKILINSFFMLIWGLPEFLVYDCGFPSFIVVLVNGGLFTMMLIGIVQFIYSSSRGWFGR